MEKKLYIKCKTITYLLLTPFLLLLPNLVLAAQALGDTADKLPTTKLSPQATDVSIALLSKIFGTVTGSGLVGPASTILGKMFNAFNSGILILAGVILCYTTVRSVMELAHQIQPMGRKFSWWQPIRIALGVGLLVPQATGYSFLNSIVIWVTLQGVGLADLVWKEAVIYLQQGGVVYTQPAAPGEPDQSDKIDTELISSDNGDAGTSALLKSQICIHSLENIINKHNRNITDEINANPQNYPAKGSQEYNQLMQRYAQVSFAPSYDDSPNGGAFFPGEDYPKEKPLIHKGDCGAYSWYQVPECKVAGCDTSQPQVYRDTKKTGLTQAINELDSISSHAVNNEIKFIKNDVGEDTLAFNDDFSFNSLAASRLVGAATDYQTIIYPMRVFAGSGYKLRQEPTEDKTLQYEQLIADGWIAAGRAYFEFVTLKKITGIDNKNYKFETSSLPPQGFCVSKEQCRCTRGNCNNIKSFIDKYSSNSDSDQTELWKKLAWTNTVTGNDETGAINLAKTLNQAIAKTSVSGELILPDELVDFIKEGKFKISFQGSIPSPGGAVGQQILLAFAITVPGVAPTMPAFLAANIILRPLNQSINNVVCSWAKNLGVKKAAATNATKAKTDDICTIPKDDQVEPTASPTNTPFVKLQSMGNQMIYESISIWKKLLVTLSNVTHIYLASFVINTIAAAVLAPETLLGATIGGLQALNIVIQYYATVVKFLFEMPLFMTFPIVFVFTGFMMTLGITLSYYIPLIPFMLFTLGIIGWLSFVIEAMVAAPVVALAITHPEGHELLGRANTALDLLLAVFIRPASMIFGLIASLILAYVALDVLNLSFGAIIGSAFYKTAETGAMAQIRNAIVIIIYVYIVIAIMNQCFSLIIMVPAKILRWIGIRTEGGEELRALEGIKAGVTQATQAIGRGAEAIGGYKPSIPTTPLKAREKPEKPLEIKTGKKGGT